MSTISFSDYDVYLFHEGTHYQSYKMFGAHIIEHEGISGVKFALWAPNVKAVNVVGDFNQWQGSKHPMQRINDTGIWATFIPGLDENELYKYEIHTLQGQVLLKADPYAFYSEYRPQTASKICSLNDYNWQDVQWQNKKKAYSSYEKPMLIYEVHLGSWKRKSQGQFLSYLELAEELINYVADMGYTHIELLPVTEHPFDGSWGYQVTGYYSVTSRYGTPQDLMYFIDRCHQKGIGVILDWVPAHFCKDDHGLRRFDGTALYEYESPDKAEKQEWGTLGFDFSKPEIISFLISNALFWFDIYRIDGLRVDAVTSMLYLSYGKHDGNWIPNQYGGSEHLEAVNFLKKLNEAVFNYYPTALMIAEESTDWPLVSAPVYSGGLGFNYKWNMGWMNDILRYMELEPIYRKYHHDLLTFSLCYAFSENYVLALSHDEVVHGKKALLNKMPGDYWQKFANLRLLYGYMMTHPGKKHLFMGGEFAQFDEWHEGNQLTWGLLDFDMHKKLQYYTCCLNNFYQAKSALWEIDYTWEGFQWIEPNDSTQSIVAFLRRAKAKTDYLIIVCNFTPTVHKNYRIGVPEGRAYKEIFNSDLEQYGGSGQSNVQIVKPEAIKWQERPYSIELLIPPLAFIVLETYREMKLEENK